MNNTLDALRNLYVALGGNIENVENLVIIPDLINAIAEIMGGIMTYTSEMLEPYYIHLTATSATGGTSDETAAEIIEAFEAGRKILVTGILNEAEQTLTPIAISMKDGEIAINAIGIIEPTGTMVEALLPWSDADDNAWELKFYTLTPAT